jgi:hypothetical protein
VREVRPISCVATIFACASLAVPARADAPAANRYVAYASCYPSFAYGPGGTIVVELPFQFDVSNLTVDPAALAFKMRRVDGRLRAWTALRTSSNPGGDSTPAKPAETVTARIPGVRGATYEFSYDVAPAIKTVAPGPSAAEISDADHAHETFPNPKIEPHSIFLLTVASEKIAEPDIALARVQHEFAGRIARVIRTSSLDGDYGNPHAPPYRVTLKPGDRVKISSLSRAVGEQTTTGSLGTPAAAGLPADVERFAMDAVHVTVEKAHSTLSGGDAAPNDLWLTFASPDEIELYLRPVL